MDLSSWSRRELAAAVAVVLALVTVTTLALLGATAAITAGRAVELGSMTLTTLSVLAQAAVLCGALLVLWAGVWLVQRAVASRLARPHSLYLPYVSIAVGVLTWAMGDLVSDDPLVRLVLSTLAAFASVLAGEVAKRWPLSSIGVSVCVPVVALVVAQANGRIDTVGWLRDAGRRDLALTAVVLVIAIGVPAVVAVFERHWRSPQWMFADRVRRRWPRPGVDRSSMGTERSPAAAQKAGGAIQRRWHASHQEVQRQR